MMIGALYDGKAAELGALRAISGVSSKAAG
jgi:hypothetical protein